MSAACKTYLKVKSTSHSIEQQNIIHLDITLMLDHIAH